MKTLQVSKLQLEICCYSIDDIILALESGADRIEFCSGRTDGGLTPSYGQLMQIKELNIDKKVPINIMIRPRGGDFCYSDLEIKSMLKDIQCVLTLGFSGIVIGCLTEQRTVHWEQLTQLKQAAQSLKITFHRAFDLVDDPILTALQLKRFGVDLILTSGQAQTAIAGKFLLSQLIKLGDEVPTILAGAGVNHSNIEVLKALGLTQFHASATQIKPSLMQNLTVSMANGFKNEYLRYQVNPAEVRLIREKLNYKEFE